MVTMGNTTPDERGINGRIAQDNAHINKVWLYTLLAGNQITIQEAL